MHLFADIFSLLPAVAGWFYLFYSKAAGRLAGLESVRRNALRVRLRRANGLALFLIAIGFFAGFNSVDDQRTPRAFFMVWMSVLILLLIITVLAMVDMRLTWKLRHSGGVRGRQ